ncbi:MAG: oligosaccharide flippase family protein [Deltaproteobacteria bacterium]|nr:oligosaccharide flippase family protein [Deltaproteobacteria bacterium]
MTGGFDGIKSHRRHQMKERAEIKQKVNRGLAWIGLASTLIGLLDILAQILILRFWVSPSELGIATLAVALFPILDMATDMGMSSAVIQGDDHTEEKICTVFWMNVLVSLVLFSSLCVGGPLLGYVHGHPVIGSMLIAYGSKIIFQNAYFIPAALLKRELRFKELSVIRIFANIAEFVAKIGFAWGGFEVWCFVFGPLARSVVTCVGVQACHPWCPRMVLRLREAASYMRYGLKTSASQILFYFYTNVDYQVVSYYFGTAATGFYRAAYELVLEPVRVISHVIVEIAFPTFARLRTKRSHLIEQFISFTRLNLVVVVPFLTVVFLGASEILQVLWGDSWAPASTAVRVLCLVGVLRALSFVVPPLLDGIGFPTITLFYTLVASVVLPALYILFAIHFGPRVGYLSVALAWAVGYPIAFSVLSYLALSRIGLPAMAYLRRVMGIPGCTAVALGVGAVIRWGTRGWAPLPRLAAIAGVTMGLIGVLLAYLQGISPRAVVRALGEKGGASSKMPDSEEPQDLPPMG